MIDVNGVNAQAYEKKRTKSWVHFFKCCFLFGYSGEGLSKFPISCDSDEWSGVLRIVLFHFYIKFRVQELSSWLKQTNHMPAPGGKGQSEKRWEISSKVSTFIATAAETLAGHVTRSLH